MKKKSESIAMDCTPEYECLQFVEAWKELHENAIDKGLDEFLGFVTKVYEKEIAQKENIEFLKNFRKYSKAHPDEGKFNRVGEALSKSLVNERDELDAMVQNLTVKKCTIEELEKYADDLDRACLEHRKKNYTGKAQDLLSEKYADASKSISMGCTTDGDEPCKICKEEVFVFVPIPQSDEPNANGDVFPPATCKVSSKVTHENRVVGEVTVPEKDKVTVRFDLSDDAQIARKRILEGLAGPPEFYDLNKDYEKVHVKLFERVPENGIPGVVGLSIDVIGVPVMFSTRTDHGNHREVCRYARLVLQAIRGKKGVEK